VRAAARLLTVATDSSGCRRPSPMTKGRRFTASCRRPHSGHPCECSPDELISTRPAMQNSGSRVQTADRPGHPPDSHFEPGAAPDRRLGASSRMA